MHTPCCGCTQGRLSAHTRWGDHSCTECTTSVASGPGLCAACVPHATAAALSSRACKCRCARACSSGVHACCVRVCVHACLQLLAKSFGGLSPPLPGPISKTTHLLLPLARGPPRTSTTSASGLLLLPLHRHPSRLLYLQPLRPGQLLLPASRERRILIHHGCLLLLPGLAELQLRLGSSTSRGGWRAAAAAGLPLAWGGHPRSSLTSGAGRCCCCEGRTKHVNWQSEQNAAAPRAPPGPTGVPPSDGRRPRRMAAPGWAREGGLGGVGR